MCFPMFPRFCGQTFMEAADKELAPLVRSGLQRLDDRGVVRRHRQPAHPAAPSSLCGIRTLAAAEVRRNAARGAQRGVLHRTAHQPGPPVHPRRRRPLEPLFAACEETATVLCMHIALGSRMPSTSPDAPPAVPSTLTSNNAMGRWPTGCSPGRSSATPTSRSPTARARSAGSPTSWSGPTWCGSTTGGGTGSVGVIPSRPAATSPTTCTGASSDDRFGLANIDAIGVNNVTFETDYPHSDSTWPHTKEIAEKAVRGAVRRGDLQDHAGQRYRDAPLALRELMALGCNPPPALRPVAGGRRL